MKMKTTRFLKQQGISLLEVLLSVSIIAVILVLATKYFFVASNNTKVNSTVTQISGLVAATNTWKGINPYYDTLSIQTLYNAGQLQDFPGLTVNASTASLYDLWGDLFTIAPATSAAGSVQATITLTLPNAGLCTAVSHAFVGSSCAGDKAFTYTFPPNA
jgi:Tfp pilus assembly protein PilV